MILIPAIDSSTEAVRDSLASSGLWSHLSFQQSTTPTKYVLSGADPELLLLHHSQSSFLPSTILSISVVSQNSAFLILPLIYAFTESIA